MSLATRGLGHPGGLLATAGLGCFESDLPNGGGASTGISSEGKYQVLPRRIPIPSPAPDLQPLKDDELEIVVHGTEYQVSIDDDFTVSEAIKAATAIPERIEAIQKEHAVSARKARSLLRSRVAREIKAVRQLREEHLYKDDVLEILIITGVI